MRPGRFYRRLRGYPTLRVTHIDSYLMNALWGCVMKKETNSGDDSSSSRRLDIEDDATLDRREFMQSSLCTEGRWAYWPVRRGPRAAAEECSDSARHNPFQESAQSPTSEEFKGIYSGARLDHVAFPWGA